MITLKEHLVLHGNYDNLPINTHKANHLILHAYEWLCSNAKKHTPIVWLRLIAQHELTKVSRDDIRIKRMLMELIRSMDYCIGGASQPELVSGSSNGNSKFHSTFRALIDTPQKFIDVDFRKDSPLSVVKKYLAQQEQLGTAIGFDRVAVAHYEAFLELLCDESTHPSDAMAFAETLGFGALTPEDKQFIMLSILFNVPMSSDRHVTLMHFLASDESGI